jgi:hypothetical protein
VLCIYVQQFNNAILYERWQDHARFIVLAIYSQYMKPSITPTKPALMPAISFPPLEPDFLVLLGVAPELVGVPVAAAPEAPVLKVCPRLGSLTSPFTNQPPGVEVGHAGGVNVAVLYAELATPVGVKVSHCECKLA